jgi:hypothetical protein
MAYKYELPNMSAGMDDAITGTVTAVPSFIPMFLLFVFGVVFIGGVVSQKRKTGSSDFPMWATIASLSTLMIALPMTLVAGMLSGVNLSIVVAITIASGFWLFTSQNRNEV